ncbi:hypothetical protein J6R97_02145 [bacterium]|nr:hypothetical protein [bacterium]
MKKMLFTSLIAITLACVPADSSMVLLDYFGETLVTTNNIERTLIVNSDDGKQYNIAIRPLEESIKNVDGSYTIPLENLYINNTKEDVYLKYNEYSNIFYDTVMDGVPRNMTAKIKNYGIVPAGTYSILLEVQAIDIQTNEVASMSSFNLQFIVPIVHELNNYSEDTKIKVSSTNAFKPLHKNASEVAPMVYIRSNTDWVLSIDATDFGETIGNYYVKTTSASPNVTSRLQEPALIIPNREIILARGKAPADNEFVAVEFSVENPAKGAYKTGEYINRIKYILREGQK